MISDYKKKYSYRVIFKDKMYKFHNTGKKLECYLPVSLDTEAGQYTLVFNALKKNKIKDTKFADIIIKSGNFKIENVRFSKEKKKKIHSKKNAEEIQLIARIKETVSEKKYFDQPFIMPVHGKIKGKFGAKRKSGSLELWVHKGIDISAKIKTPVIAPASGKVILTREDFDLHGKTIMIDHGLGIVTIYIHLDVIKVSNSDFVKKGDTIGLLGNTGLTTAPNLHWGVYVQEKAVNPLWWIKNE